MRDIKKFRAFTLIELVVVMGLITMISLLVLPYTINDLKNNSLRSTSIDLVSQIYNYQSNASTGRDNSSYGIRLNSNSYTLFTGDSFATGNNFEEVFLPAGIIFSNINLTGGAVDIVFPKGSLKPSVYGTFRIVDEFNVYEISINVEGFLEWYRL